MFSIMRYCLGLALTCTEFIELEILIYNKFSTLTKELHLMIVSLENGCYSYGDILHGRINSCPLSWNHLLQTHLNPVSTGQAA